MSQIERPPLDPLSLTIFYPCYNEEANIERVTLRALQVGRQIAADLEVIIVNDGSKDATAERADKLAAEHAEVRAVHNNPNLGYGGALQRGFREASKNWVFYTDGDGQFDFAEIPRLLPLLETHDIVSCYRMNRCDPLMRKLNAWCWCRLVNLLFGFGLRDVDCAFKIYPRTLFERITMKSTGALIDTEILAKAHYLGYKIAQLGVHHYPRTAGEQTGANFGVIARAFKELFTLSGEIKAERQPRSPESPS